MRCGQTDRIAVVRAGVKGSAVAQHVEHFSAAAHGRQGESRGDCLAVDGQIGREVVVFAGSAGGEAETCDDFIKNRNGSVSSAEVDEARQKPFARLARAAVRQQRLGNHGRDLFAFPVENGTQALEIVPWQDERPGKLVRWLASACRLRFGRFAGRRVVADQYVVHPAMVMAFELHDFVAPGERSCNPQGRLHGFAAGVGEDHLLDTRNELHDLPCHPDFKLMLSAERVASL